MQISVGARVKYGKFFRQELPSPRPEGGSGFIPAPGDVSE